MAITADRIATHRRWNSHAPHHAVIGTSSALSTAIGTCPARHDSPKTAIEPAAMIEVSGIQCPLLGTGRTAGSGRVLPTSRKLQMTGTVKPSPDARRWATRV